MPTVIDLDKLDELTVPERLAIIDRITESLEVEHVSPDDIPEWHKAILDERLKKADADPGAGIPWRELFKKWDKS